jgi:transposase
MRADQACTGTEELVLAVSLELAAAKWKVVLHAGLREKPAAHTVAQPQAAARLQAVLDVIEQQKLKWSLPGDTEPGELRGWPGRVLDLPRAAGPRDRMSGRRSREHPRRASHAAREDGPARCHQAGHQSARVATPRARPHARVVHVPSPQDEGRVR